MALDEIVYVLQGGGATRLREEGTRGSDGHQFEWKEQAIFLVPGHHQREFSNLRGDEPVRLLHYDYLPLAMSVVPEADFFLGSPYRPTTPKGEVRETFSKARLMTDPAGLRWVGGGKKASGKTAYWYGNFFPDMSAWDQLESNAGRGAGGRTVSIQFANSEMGCHMSVFDSRTYKKAHRHGPGRVIVVPSGEGYTLMWLEGQDEPIVIPWQEAALFVPPDRWFHQHFNLGAKPARYLALHPPMQFHGYAERPEDRRRDQIEYPDESPAIRERFERELARRGLASLMPDEAYSIQDFQWK
jgi:hypothetical protein